MQTKKTLNLMVGVTNLQKDSFSRAAKVWVHTISKTTKEIDSYPQGLDHLVCTNDRLLWGRVRVWEVTDYSESYYDCFGKKQ